MFCLNKRQSKQNALRFLYACGVQQCFHLSQVVLRLSDFSQVLSAVMQAFENRLCIERKSQAMRWGEVERQRERRKKWRYLLVKYSYPLQCETVWTLCCSHSDNLRTGAFMITVDVRNLIFSKMYLKFDYSPLNVSRSSEALRVCLLILFLIMGDEYLKSDSVSCSKVKGKLLCFFTDFP